MPKIAEKAKALNGKGVVFSYICEPQKFYFRELIPGTKRYRSRLIEGAETIEEALSGCIDAYTALRQTESFSQRAPRSSGNQVLPLHQCHPYAHG